MEHQAFESLFREIFANNGLQGFCSQENIAAFEELTSILLEANSRFNLTAIKEIPDIIAKHYADCLLAEHLFPVGATVMDIGCGGGFPTFPLAIVRKDLNIVAVDSTQKKIDFVAQTAQKLGLLRVKAVCARAEAPEMRAFREKFDVVTSRAMARMPILSELALPFAAVGGRIVALKGAQGREELSDSLPAICILGGNEPTFEQATLITPAGEETRFFLTVSKERQTPSQYPRQYAAILKKPL